MDATTIGTLAQDAQIRAAGAGYRARAPGPSFADYLDSAQPAPAKRGAELEALDDVIEKLLAARAQLGPQPTPPPGERKRKPSRAPGVEPVTPAASVTL